MEFRVEEEFTMPEVVLKPPDKTVTDEEDVPVVVLDDAMLLAEFSILPTLEMSVGIVMVVV